MKKLLYIFFASLSLLSSCNSDNDNLLNSPNDDVTSNDSKQTVTLRLNIASNTSTRSANDTVNSDIQINKLIYAVFKEEDRDIPNAVVQPKDDPEGYALFQYYDSVSVINNTLPEINLDLNEGNYHIAILATARMGNASEMVINMTEGAILGDALFAVNGTTSSNEFKATVPVTVGNTHIDVNAHLTRAVGKVEIVINDLDKLPSSVQSISARIETYIGLSKYWSPVKPYSIGLTKDKYARYGVGDIDVPLLTKSQFAGHGKDNPITFYSLETGNSGVTLPMVSSGGDLYLYLNDTTTKPSGNVGSNKKVLVSKNVKIYPNKISRFTGTVTGNEYGFSLSFNHEWDNDVTIVEIEK